MRLLAERAIASIRCSGGNSSPGWFPNSSIAIWEATSPALAPPIPSATTKNGGSRRSESSFDVRCMPTSLLPTCSTILRAIAPGSLLVAILAVADPDEVGAVQPFLRMQLPSVQVGPVRRPHVLDIHEVTAGKYSRVGGRRDGIVHEDVRAIAATEGHAARDVERRPRLMPHRSDDLEPRLDPRPRLRRRLATAGGRRRLLDRRAALVAPEITPGTAGHPEEKEREHSQEAELQRDRERLVQRKASPARRSVRSVRA